MPPPPIGAPAAAGSYSPWIARVGAYVLRGLIFLPAFVVISVLGDIGVVLGGVAYVVTIVAAVRMVIQRAHLGYDLGDRLVGQKLVRAATNEPMGSGWSVFGRALAHILDALPCYLGFLWPLWDAQNQTFADKVVSTVVVTDQSAARHEAGALIANSFMFWTPVTKS